MRGTLEELNDLCDKYKSILYIKHDSLEPSSIIIFCKYFNSNDIMGFIEYLPYSINYRIVIK